MSDPFVGEIRMFGGNFAPQGWAFCDGQLLAISQNDALFSLFGTIYGGDGRTTFGLPDLRGRAPIHMGTGPGLSPRPIGQKAGAEQVTLTANQIAAHAHPWRAADSASQGTNPVGAMVAKPGQNIYTTETPNTQIRDAISLAGGGQVHTNVQPFQCVYYIVSLFGIYPSRN